MTLAPVRIDSWQDIAACIGHVDLFYGFLHERQADRNHREAQAVAICAECPVRAECLSDALTRREDHGVWGGKTPEQRRAIHAATDKRAKQFRALQRGNVAVSLFDDAIDVAEARYRDAEGAALAHHGGKLRPYGCDCEHCAAAAQALVDYQWHASYGASA